MPVATGPETLLVAVGNRVYHIQKGLRGCAGTEQSRALRRHDEARPERRQFCWCVSSVLRGHGRPSCNNCVTLWHVCVGVSSRTVRCVRAVETHRALHVRLTRASNLKTTLDRSPPCFTSCLYSFSRTNDDDEKNFIESAGGLSLFLSGRPCLIVSLARSSVFLFWVVACLCGAARRSLLSACLVTPSLFCCGRVVQALFPPSHRGPDLVLGVSAAAPTRHMCVCECVSVCVRAV